MMCNEELQPSEAQARVSAFRSCVKASMLSYFRCGVSGVGSKIKGAGLHVGRAAPG